MPFIKPAEMDFSGKRFSMIISGMPGVGKTSLALSAPKPLLVDFDQGVSRVKAQHRTDTFQVESYSEFLQGLQAPEMDEIETVVIDTGGALITYMSQHVIKQNPKNGQSDGSLSLKGFGAIKSEFKRLAEYLKHEVKKNVIYIFHTVEEKKKVGRDDVVAQALLCDGSAKNLVWQFIDVGCYYYVDGGRRVLGFTPTEQYVAKSVHGVSGLVEAPHLGDTTPNTFLTKMFEQMQESLKQENEIFAEERKKYADAIAKGKEAITNAHNVEEFNLLADVLKGIGHALTSKVELSQLYKDRARALGLEFDLNKKEWVDNNQPPEDEKTEAE